MTASTWRKAVEWRRREPVAFALLLGGFTFAWLFTLGIPLWDDDFTSWSRKVEGHSLFRYLWEWIWPVSTQPEHWGFNERPSQAFIYKFFEYISGYDSWSYFLFKSAIYAAVGWRIYRLGLLLGGSDSRLARWASAGVAAFYLVSPGPVAALILLQDFAPVAALVNLLLLEWIYRSIETTPVSWQGWPRLTDPQQRRWLGKWVGIAVCLYLGYKTKADVKLLGPVLAVYAFAVRPRQWAFFAVPVAVAGLLAVPWGPGVLTRKPPFMPGSGGSSIGWMFQEAKLERVLSYFWNPEAFRWSDFYLAAPVSLAGLLGPFLLVVAAAFAFWRVQGADRPLTQTRGSATGRAWLLFALWWAVVMVATSALSDINFTFRIRYGILTLTPVAVLLAGLGVSFTRSLKELPRLAFGVAATALLLQASMNLARSAQYRRDMGVVMIAVDQAYARIATDFPRSRLALLPDFRPYDYRPGAGQVFDEKTWLSKAQELGEKKFPVGDTLLLSWSPTLWEEAELIEFYRGCRAYSPFDWIWPCPRNTGVALMRWLGRDALYEKGETLRRAGQNAEARKLHEEFLARHPGSLAAKFVISLESFALQDPARAWEMLQDFPALFPGNNAVLYNAALAAAGTNRYNLAIRWLETVREREPSNYGVLMNLQDVYRKSENVGARERIVRELRQLYPQDESVKKL